MICVTLPASTGGSLTNLEKTWKPGAQTLTFLALMPFSASISCKALRTVASRVLSCAPSAPSDLQRVLLQAQPARFVDLELGQLEAARSEINGEK